MVLRGELEIALLALRRSLDEAGLGKAKRVRTALMALGDAGGGSLGEALRQIAATLGSTEVTGADLAERWRVVQAETDRLAGLRPDLRRLATIAGLVRASGAPTWAAQISDQPVDEATDPVLPADWRDAFDCARAAGLLRRVADRDRVQRLNNERAEIVARRERRFLEVIALQTERNLHARLTPSMQQALRQFLAAIARMPKSAGARTAPRQRRVMRDAMQRAFRAIPCWIMPEWRVAEQLPSELGAFDLVIIDEASQSNILALPVILHGKKLLIVGDDRQVSPVVIGLEEAKINRLRALHLSQQPLAEQLDPATSLYELGGMMYPEKVVVLREHFRCVEPIIRFSSRFYQDGLVPLRLPKSSERIDPPLVDILVEDGRRRGDVNHAEADVIVREIRALMDDPVLNAHGKRSIGVISLHANKQAQLIYERLVREIGPERMSDHSVMCGDAATFQGQERDIVLLSMVHDAKTASMQSARLYEQRYNVALSRARDRMVLVRSVTASDLRDGDIKLAVLRHFQDPWADGRIGQTDDVLNACQSGFEREVGRRLLDAGYRLRSQVSAGGYRIDFVVEGHGDRRLAIELDGDAFHGPERWAADLARQKALERVGWVFWRCWASEWQADRDGILRNLVATLTQRGIEPIGTVAANAPAVEFRTLRALPAAPAADDDPAAAAQDAEPTPADTPVGDAADDDRTVRLGDAVVVRFADDNQRSLTVQIVADGSADGSSRILPTAPMAKAILGRRTEDEATLMADGKERIVVIEAIQDGAP